MRDDCPFCEIVAGRAPARVVHEDEHTLAFFPLAPATRGHTLVVPRTHADDLWTMDGTAARNLLESALSVGHVLREILAPEGINVVNSAGTVATQTVFHVHVHLLPRWRDDTMGRIWPEPGEGHDADDTELDALADSIRARRRPRTG
jgi:histidine triad (HIT) family protein